MRRLNLGFILAIVFSLAVWALVVRALCLLPHPAAQSPAAVTPGALTPETGHFQLVAPTAETVP